MGNLVLNGLTKSAFYFFDLALEPDRVISNFLFNQPHHLFLQSKRGWRIFGFTWKGKTVAQIAFHIKGKEARSPRRAPFGSLQLDGHIGEKQLLFFLTNIERILRQEGIRNVVIQNYPEIYNPITTQLLLKTLNVLGFTVKTQVASAIHVDQKDFASKIRISKRQRLRKSEARFQFEQVAVSQLSNVYRFIETCRLQKNQALSMSLSQLRKAVKTFPNDFLLFEVKEGKQRVSAAIVVRVSKAVLYTFYYAHDKAYDKLSPVVFLLAGIYSFAQTSKIEWVDLGTSMSGEKVNVPLLHFKESVGGKHSPKFIFEKTI